MEDIFTKGGYDHITGRIAEAIGNGSREAVISGNWILDREVRLPSDFTLVLEDCHLRMADGCYSNAFVNEHHGTDIGRTAEGTDRNISLIGRGRAIVDGGRYNGLSERNHGRDGLPPIWKNNLLLFTNVEGFRVSNISFRNQRWWALNFIFCSHGYIGDLDFRANDTAVDGEGREYRGLKRSAYDEVLVKNADGVDLRVGCHHITVENITGFTEDDSVALTALMSKMERSFLVEGAPTEISHVQIRNIRTAAFCTNVRLLNQGGTSLHHILIDGVYDMAEEYDELDSGLYAVRIGDTRLYGDSQSTEEQTHHITVKNVRGGGEYALSLAGGIGWLALENIEPFGKAGGILDQRTDNNR